MVLLCLFYHNLVIKIGSRIEEIKVTTETAPTEIAAPSIVGYLLDNQGKTIKCKVTINSKGYIVFYPVDEECDRNANND